MIIPNWISKLSPVPKGHKCQDIPGEHASKPKDGCYQLHGAYGAALWREACGEDFTQH